MKTIFVFIVSILFAVSAFAGSLRISFNGNKDFQVAVDGETYTSDNYLNDDVVLNNLSGNHRVTVYRMNKRGRMKQVYSSDVIVGVGEEIHLTINSDGSIQREELSSSDAYGYRSPMSDASFNNLYRNISNQWWQPEKMSLARDAFGANNYFSTAQVRSIVGLMNSEADRLELLKLSYDKITDPSNFSQLYDLLRSGSSRSELDDYVRNNSYGDAYNGYKAAMNDVSFNQLYRNIVDQRNKSKRLNAALNAFNTGSHYFTVSQVKQIISSLNDESYRLQLAKASIDNIVDVENLNQLFDLFYNQTSREELDNYIRTNGYANSNYTSNYHSAMTEASFNDLYNNIRSKWLPFGKYNAAVDAFNSSNNYFTASQVRQIIALLSSESNRLDLAKMAFDNIVDPQNISQLYDLFSSQSSIDELKRYINSTYHYQL